MSVYIAFLRGINVAGQKKIKMADLRKSLEVFPLNRVATYLQSGNILLESNTFNRDDLEIKIRGAIAASFGFEVSVLVLSYEELTQLMRDNPYQDPELLSQGKVYFTLLFKPPGRTSMNALQMAVFENEACTVTPSCVYLVCYEGMGRAKLNNNLIEKKLAVSATTRNYRTMTSLLQMAAAYDVL